MNQSTIQMMSIVFGLAMYVLFAFPLYTMGQKVGAQNPWFAFVPFLNTVLALEIAGKDLWWIILFFIPCINVIVGVIVMMSIAEAMDKPSWLGVLILVPVVNLALPFYLAYA